MNKMLYIIICVMLVTTILPNVTSYDQIEKNIFGKIENQFDSPYIEGEVIIKFKNDDGFIKIINSLRNDYRIQCVDSFIKNSQDTSLNNIVRIEFSEIVDIQSIIKKYSFHPDIEYIEPNFKCYPHEMMACNNYESIYDDINNEILKTPVTPNDPFFEEQWALHNTGQTGGSNDADIDAIEACDIITGSPDITVAIIDTGIDLTHPDLKNNIWENSDEIPDNGIDDDNNGYVDDVQGYDFVNEDNDPYPLDHNGHGTIMSGVIAAMADNEIGISGITWNCKIMPVQVVDANWIPNGNSIFEGIKYAADNGAKVICMALGYTFPSSALKDTIDYAFNKGALICCAAGNFGNDRKIYPGAYENVIAVAGTDHSDNRMEYLYEFNGEWVNSSYGDWVDIAAPGENIYTTSPTYHVTLCDTWGYELNYDVISGTTLAAPVVAGVAALVFSKNPDYSPDKVTAILKANSDPYDSEYDLGCGRVNAYNALMGYNSEPDKPEPPVGPTNGKPNEFYEYSVLSIDPDGDSLYYLFDWGDDSNSGWLGPYENGEECKVSNNWTIKGEFEIKVKAKDIYGLESEWSDPLFVSMPKNKVLENHCLSKILDCLRGDFPFLEYFMNVFGGCI